MNVKSKVRARFAVEVILAFAILTGLAVWAFDWNNPERRRHQLLEAIKLVESEQNRDAQKALSIALKLANSGDRNAKLLAAILLTHAPSPLERDEKKASEFYAQAAEGGSLLGCRLNEYVAGKEIDLVRLANCGDAFAQSMLAHINLDRIKDTPDSQAPTLVARLEAAAFNGDRDAQLELGRLYLFGKLVSKDDVHGRSLLRSSLESGNGEAGEVLVVTNMIARNDYSLKGMSPDDVNICLKAADFGAPFCQGAIGLLYLTGSNLPTDYVLAYKWLNLAIARSKELEQNSFGSRHLKRFRDARNLVEGEISGAERAEAQRLTREWKPREIVKSELPPLLAVLQELRNEMDGNFPVIPKLPAQSASLPGGSNSQKADSQSSRVPPRVVPLTAEEEKTFIPNGGKTIEGQNPLSPSSKSGPEIAQMESAEKKVAPEKLTIELVSQSLCGSVVKNRAALSGQTGLIRGCKKRQQGGRSSIMVDNTANDTAVLVKLYPHGKADAAAARVFSIRAKDSWTENNIRAGTYELRYEDMSTSAFTKTEALTIDEQRVDGGVKFSRLTVTLFKVQNGNMKTQSIAKSEFED